MTCIALPVVHALDISRRYGAEWQQYYGERIDTDDDYAYDYGAQPFGDGAYFQQLSGELPDRSGEQVARPASSDELATPDLTGESSDDNDQTCVTGTYSPSGSNCSAFHVCRRSRLTEVSCPSDMWFDPRHRDDVLCNYPEVVCAADNSVCDCADKYPPLPPDPLLEPGVTCRADQRFHFTASQVDCGRYFVCFDEHVRRLECREGMQYNPESEQCDYPEIVNCQVSGSLYELHELYFAIVADHRSGLSARGCQFPAACRAGGCVLLVRARL